MSVFGQGCWCSQMSWE